MEKGKFVTKQGIECPNCGYLNQECKEHYAKCDNCQTEYEEPVATVLCSAGLASIAFTRPQEKQLKYLTENGGKYSAGTIFVQMPNGKTMSVDPLGRVNTLAG